MREGERESYTWHRARSVARNSAGRSGGFWRARECREEMYNMDHSNERKVLIVVIHIGF